MPDAPQMIELRGRVVRKRKVSARLGFMDLEPEAAGVGKGMAGDLVVLVVKDRSVVASEDIMHLPAGDAESEAVSSAWKMCGVSSVKEVMKSVSLGDSIVVEGLWERSSTAPITSFRVGSTPTVTVPWSQISKVPFRTRACKRKHIALGAALGVSNSLCKFFTTTKSCPKGDACQFRHTTDPGERQAWVKQRRSLKRERQALIGDHLNPHTKAKKGSRADVFAKWIVGKFGGVESLSRGSGILDVAGGRGDLSFELCTRLGATCTTIDPRKKKLNKRQRRWLKKVAKRGGESKIVAAHQHELFNSTFANQHKNLVEAASLIVGMHPDEATEEIVDVALHHGKPFAIVPCCVFPKNSSQKNLSFEAWCDYLLKKAPGIECEFLNFQGRNKVIYLRSGRSNSVEKGQEKGADP